MLHIGTMQNGDCLHTVVCVIDIWNLNLSVSFPLSCSCYFSRSVVISVAQSCPTLCDPMDCSFVNEPILLLTQATEKMLKITVFFLLHTKLTFLCGGFFVVFVGFRSHFKRVQQGF